MSKIGEEHEIKVRKFVRQNPNSKQKEIAYALGLETRTIRQILRRARRSGKDTKFIVKIDKRSRAYRMPNEEEFKSRKNKKN